MKNIALQHPGLIRRGKKGIIPRDNVQSGYT